MENNVYNSNTTNVCNTSYCCKKTWALATIAALIVIYAFDYIFHGIILKPMYEATSQFWRPEADMKNFWAECLLMHLVFAGTFTCLYACFCCARDGVCNMKKGIKLGLKVGILLGVSAFGAYIMMPIPLNLGLAWLAGAIVRGVLVGAVVGAIYKAKLNRDRGTTIGNGPTTTI